MHSTTPKLLWVPDVIQHCGIGGHRTGSLSLPRPWGRLVGKTTFSVHFRQHTNCRFGTNLSSGCHQSSDSVLAVNLWQTSIQCATYCWSRWNVHRLKKKKKVNCLEFLEGQHKWNRITKTGGKTTSSSMHRCYMTISIKKLREPRPHIITNKLTETCHLGSDQMLR